MSVPRALLVASLTSATALLAVTAPAPAVTPTSAQVPAPVRSVSTVTGAPLVDRGTVVKVVDGDTIDVRLAHGKVRRVRLIGIDTPEVFDVVECGGPKASRSMKRMLPVGTRVKLTSDPTQDRKDFYGRILRYVTEISTGVDVNRAQVWRGWARVYVFDDDHPFRRVADYRRAQRSAKAHDRGIWGLC